MLDFFRKYQRYFFLVITVVIVISFSFFGTYSSLSSNAFREQIAFKAVDGREVSRFDLDEMASFLATDHEDRIYGVWGPNFLNDGVIRKDFLESGLAQEIASMFQKELRDDIDKRLAKEKKYTLYTHPQAHFLNVQNVWGYFSPEMKVHFDALKLAFDGLDPDVFQSRVKLYLSEKKFPASTLKHVLRYQEKQYDWVEPDQNLDQIDLSLFGYHTVEDWFGPHFTRLVSEFIINAAIIAEEKGYKVSKSEALADLVRHAQVSYQQNQSNPHLGVRSAEEYFQEQLRRLNMDSSRAIKLWRQILLFRRYFHDAGAVALIDSLASERFNDFAHKNVTMDLYKLPAALKISNQEDLQKFEIYLYAVTKQNKSDPLALPEKFLSLKDIQQKYPELVQKKYELEVAEVSQNYLQSRISLRELWNWEVEESHWQQLVKQYPTLGIQQGDTREKRFEALDNLDAETRAEVDAFAKQAIVKAHPEWVDQALKESKREKFVIGMRTKGGKMPFQGLEGTDKRQELISLLDSAAMGEQVLENSPLYRFTPNDQTYYRIAVLNRANEPEILTFAEARADGTLNVVQDRILERYYKLIREKNPLLYQKENKEWQSFQAVRELVANQFFEKIMLALEPIQKDVFSNYEQKLGSKDQAASLRFYQYLQTIKEKLINDPLQASQWIKETIVSKDESSIKGIAPSSSLQDQWKVERVTMTLNRQHGNPSVDLNEAFRLSSDSWSGIQTPLNGDLAFYQIKEQGMTEIAPTLISQQTKDMQAMLSFEAQRHLMRQVLQELKEKNALSLAYLSAPMEELTPENSSQIESDF